MLSVPVNGNGVEEVQLGHSEVLALGCSITDFALAANGQNVFHRMMRFALILADLGAARTERATKLLIVLNNSSEVPNMASTWIFNSWKRTA